MADEEGGDNSSWRQRIARQEPRDISTQTRDVRPLPAYWEKPTPLFYFETWDLKALRKSDHNQIKAGLLAIHADFLDDKTGNLPEICWRRAYDVFACPFHTAGFLTEHLVTEIIPAMVMDASASGRWAFGRKSREALIGEFRVKLGNEFYQEGYIRAVYLRLIEGRITYWRGRLILQGKFGTDDGSQSKLAAAELPDKGNPALLHEGAANDPLPALVPEAQVRVPKPAITAELPNAPISAPEDRLVYFMQQHPGTTYADIKYSATVFTAEFQDWRRGRLKPDSVMSLRIEDVLAGTTPLKKKPPKPRAE